MTPRKAQASSGKLGHTRAQEPSPSFTRRRIPQEPVRFNGALACLSFSCSNVINDIILGKRPVGPAWVRLEPAAFRFPRAPGATTAFHPRAPLTQRDRRFLPFDSTRTNANPPAFDAPPLLLAKTKGFAEPPKSASAAEPPTTPSPGVPSQFFTRFRPTISKPLRTPSASLSF